MNNSVLNVQCIDTIFTPAFLSFVHIRDRLGYCGHYIITDIIQKYFMFRFSSFRRWIHQNVDIWLTTAQCRFSIHSRILHEGNLPLILFSNYIFSNSCFSVCLCPFSNKGFLKLSVSSSVYLRETKAVIKF